MVSPPLENVAAPSYRKLSVGCLAPVTFTCNGSTFRDLHKFLSRIRTKFNPHPSSKCGYPQPAQVNSTRAGL